MKNLLFLFLLLPLLMWGQADPPSLFEVVHMKVKAGQEKAFEAVVKSHNAQFHGEGAHQASLHYNLNGPFGGMYTWVMGPTNYAGLDNRPAEGAHDADWSKVNEFVETFDSPTYWSVDTKLTKSIDESNNPKRLIWMYDIKKGQSSRWAELVGKVKEVYEKTRPDESFTVVWNEFSDTEKGYDAVILFSMDKWGKLDRQRDFSKEYEQVHGPNTWHNFLNDINDTVKGRIDWMRDRID